MAICILRAMDLDSKQVGQGEKLLGQRNSTETEESKTRVRKDNENVWKEHWTGV